LGRKGKKMMKFKVGDRVRVNNVGGSFTTYEDFFRENGLEKFKPFWTPNRRMPKEDYTVVAVGKHRENKSYGLLYLLSDSGENIYIMSNDYDELTLIESKGDVKRMFASELMEKARKEPQKYEGKKYKAVGGNVIVDLNGENFKDAYVANGELKVGAHVHARISSKLELEEIPQPVTFMEAINVRPNRIICEHNGRSKEYGGIAFTTVDNGSPVTFDEILNGKWFIKE